MSTIVPRDCRVLVGLEDEDDDEDDDEDER
jgi:hypothetical protein